ncbi:hypothetical protein C8Q74DRAFT_1218655 [Fomes fomentarius]|nr:hypothetical protein C8Q74DRAFT_1218655 [Fomes fomentarius]
MSTYYFQHYPPSASRVPSLSIPRERDGEGDNSIPAPQDGLSADRSIYIFPSPSSVPSSPSPASPGSSLISAPTDFESSDSLSLGSRSRTPSNAPSKTVPPSELEDTVDTQQHISSLAHDEMEIDVELWELSTDPGYAVNLSDSDSSWMMSLEDEVERVSAGDIDVSFLNPSGQLRRTHRLSAPQSPDTALQHYWAIRPQRRARTHSRVQTISSLSSRASSSARRAVPNPRVHIPLLSFFSSLLSIDLDDPALRLLTHADPNEAESILFPGHTTSQLLGHEETSEVESHEQSETETESDEGRPGTNGEPHGLPKLLLASLSDQSTVALRSLRSGLVYLPRSPDVALPIPRPTELFGLWRLVGELYLWHLLSTSTTLLLKNTVHQQPAGSPDTWWCRQGILGRCAVNQSKYSTPYKLTTPSVEQKTQFVGNNMKDLHDYVENSLKKLRTSDVDILYVRWVHYTDRFDYSRMQASYCGRRVVNGLRHLVASGEVLYTYGTLQANGSPMLRFGKSEEHITAEDRGGVAFGTGLPD